MDIVDKVVYSILMREYEYELHCSKEDNTISIYLFSSRKKNQSTSVLDIQDKAKMIKLYYFHDSL